MEIYTKPYEAKYSKISQNTVCELYYPLLAKT